MTARILRFRRPPRGPRPPGRRTFLIWGAAAVAVVWIGGAIALFGPEDLRLRGEWLAGPTLAVRGVRVIDGDTLRLRGERIRVLNIDTPEMPGRAKCASEGARALAAKARLTELLAEGSLTVSRDGYDRYGRTLALVLVDGRDVGNALVAEGYARPWRGHQEAWC